MTTMGPEPFRVAVVGMGTSITRDVPDFALMTGNLGRQQGWVCRCGVELKLPVKGSPLSVLCPACVAEYRGVRAGLVEAEGA